MFSSKLRDPPMFWKAFVAMKSAAFKLLLAWGQGAHEGGLPPRLECVQTHIVAQILRRIS